MIRPIAALAVALALATIVTSCALPRVYKVTVQQGNVITQQMVDSLKPGMTQEQVAYVMGEPVIKNPFAQDRWDYVYTLRVPGVVNDHMKMSLFFTDGLLSHFVGDLAPSDQLGEVQDQEQAATE
ncbi:MAG: outer membrane protein assembly factor BamE [Gammaproteobacteria bacterium]|nr:outer membrane protein assembly factor BamE [Gammaproteobacteria bacterium]